MNIIQKVVPSEKVVKVYTAFDGKEFDEYNECARYEAELRDRLISDSPDVIENESAKGNMPFDGGEYHGECAYRWFMPLNEKGVKLLNELFRTELDDSDICKWLCLAIWDDDEYTSVTGLDSCVDYAKAMFRKFDIDSEYEFLLDYAGSCVLSNLEMLRVLWTAYCLHKNYDADTIDYDSDLKEVYRHIGDVKSDGSGVNLDAFDKYMCKYIV